MLKKTLFILPITFSFVSCSWFSEPLEKIFPNLSNSNNLSVSAQVVDNRFPINRGSRFISSNSWKRISQSSPDGSSSSETAPDGTSYNKNSLNETSQVVLPYDPNIKGRLIVDLGTFYQKLELLSEKLKKDQFETKEDYSQRVRKEIETFQETESIQLKDVFILRTPLGIGPSILRQAGYEFFADHNGYNADYKMLLIRGDQKFRVYRNLIHIACQEGIALSSRLFPEESESYIVNNYWLSKKKKVDLDRNVLSVSNLEPPYAKQLLSEDRLSLETSFTFSRIDPRSIADRRNISGSLINLKIIDSQDNKVLWSLN